MAKMKKAEKEALDRAGAVLMLTGMRARLQQALELIDQLLRDLA